MRGTGERMYQDANKTIRMIALRLYNSYPQNEYSFVIKPIILAEVEYIFETVEKKTAK